MAGEPIITQLVIKDSVLQYFNGTSYAKVVDDTGIEAIAEAAALVAANTAIAASAPYNVAGLASGTAYQLTATAALVHLGTTDPSITLNKVGSWLIEGRAVLKYNAATFAANRTLTLKARRTNNTPADITGSITTRTLAITSTVTDGFSLELPPTIYKTAVATDIVQLFGALDVVPTAGSLDAVEALITATWLNGVTS